MLSRRNRPNALSSSMSQPAAEAPPPAQPTDPSHSVSSSFSTHHATSTATAPNSATTSVIDLPPVVAPSSSEPPNWWVDRHSLALLVTLYMAQGLPMGLAFGAIPFLLKEQGASYGELARFSLAGLPYSMKLLVAPIVDSLYFQSFGRRKSWIVPVQLVLGVAMMALAPTIHVWVLARDVGRLTPTFLALVALTATQDIAVDGWSLTIMQRSANVAYASTCQSLGLSIGFFATFTIFLSFSNDAFCDDYFRPIVAFALGNVFKDSKGALVNLTGALKLVGVFYIALTTYVTVWKVEAPPFAEEKKSDILSEVDDKILSLKDGQEVQDNKAENQSQSIYRKLMSTYRDMFFALRLPAVKSLVFCLLIAKVGVSAYDNVTPLKLLENGFSKEKMASMAVLQTPFSLLGTLIAGRWVAKRSPIHVYLIGFGARITLSLAGPLTVHILKRLGGVVTTWFYFFVLILSIVYSFAAECLMFVGIGAFFLTITQSSVHVAGSYLTLLNTSSNLGGIWHKAAVLYLIDKLTVRSACELSASDISSGKKCDIVTDGYYVISAILLPIALLVGRHLYRTLPKLEKLPDSSWKATR